jgi:MtN3 and saliva related transmembrane protein
MLCLEAEIIHKKNEAIIFMEKIVGVISGVLTSVSMLPQFFKLIKKKDSKDVSLGMLAVLIAGVGGWIYYGILRNDLIIVFTNSFAFLVNLLTMILAINYRKR